MKLLVRVDGKGGARHRTEGKGGRETKKKRGKKGEMRGRKGRERVTVQSKYSVFVKLPLPGQGGDL